MTFPAAFPGGVVIDAELWYALDPAARHRLLMGLAERYGVWPVGAYDVAGDLPDFGGGPGLLPGGAHPGALGVEVTPGGVNWLPVIAAAMVGLVAALVAS